MGCQWGLVASGAGLFAEDAGTRDPAVDADWPHEPAGSFATALEDRFRPVLVVEHEGQVVGHLIGSLTGPSVMRPGKSATLMSLYVRPAGEGAGRTEVTAYPDNTEAPRFSARHGFAPPRHPPPILLTAGQVKVTLET
ncbi:GNAT family N-acetyltransferase [Streptomyces soliscabiei]|uniref:GNAT family N-acetyltransferase n=1 Tax=Streptomyces soliscabiei TaxID=588897 RepID=UPI0029B150E5|nr:GNAT family N-acetyltransferase [Streptomyces sp. NY05-11A]MDX2677958.1 GNAT family N-acetyltransferase [Streptomyces sp. NY05-11A]